MNRRDFLNALPISAAAMSLSADVLVSASDTPVLRVFREWKEFHDWSERPETDQMSDEDYNQVIERREEIESRLLALPSSNSTDVLAKLVAFTFNGQVVPDDGGNWSARVLAEAVTAVDGALT